MHCRTDTSWLYWSRGEASFLNHHFWMRVGSWMMLAWDKVLELGVRFGITGSSDLVRLGLRCAPAPCQHLSSGWFFVPQVPHSG